MNRYSASDVLFSSVSFSIKKIVRKKLSDSILSQAIRPTEKGLKLFATKGNARYGNACYAGYSIYSGLTQASIRETYA